MEVLFFGKKVNLWGMKTQIKRCTWCEGDAL